MIQIFNDHSDILLEGFKFTLYSSTIALVISLIIGTLLAILQISTNKGVRILANAYVEFFRNIPLLIIVMFFYVVVPLYWFQIDGFTAGTIGLTIYTSAFI
ncbi:MAG: ABC transporter permease subunit, partial [Carnobacterium sp.]